MKKFLILTLAALAFIGCSNNSNENNDANDHEDGYSGATEVKDTLHYEGEVHLANIRQITFGGDNAEAYFSFDGTKLVFQAKNPAWGADCDQIYVTDIDKQWQNEIPKLISTGKGRTTCSYFMPGDSTIVYASTHEGDVNCPPEPPHGPKYVWPIYPDFEIYVADLDGNIISKLTDREGYDAEATVSPKGDKIVFTSTRTGDLELFTMNIDGSDVKQITHELGYDGGAFFSPDGEKLIFRSSRPQTEEEIKEYKDLLAQNLVQPTNMELYVCNVDGSDLKKITDLGNANWAPFFHPSGEKVIFSSNHKSAKEGGRPQFNLFMTNLDGTEIEQITYDGVFDAFPMFSPDGTKLVFSSNRNNGGTHETNMFIADWVE